MVRAPRPKPKRSDDSPVTAEMDEQFQAVPPRRATAQPKAKSEPDVLPGQARFRALDEVLSPLSKIVIFVTILLGGFQYFQNQHEARVERTMSLISEWNESGLRDVYDDLNAAIWPLYSPASEQIETLVRAGANRGDLLANIGEKVTDQGTGLAPGADRHVERLFEYFERAAVCSNEHLCDYEVFELFLGNEFRSFWQYFSSFAKRKDASGYSGYGEWTERLAKGEIARRAFFGFL